MHSVAKIQTSSKSTWLNAAGESVPLKFVPKVDRIKEVLSDKLLKRALKIEADLYSFHADMNAAIEEVFGLQLEEYTMKFKKAKKEGKGSIVFYNFDRSIKSERDMNEIVKWDHALMTEAHESLTKYISTNLTEANILISELVTSAFANTRGMIDSGKVFQILKYKDKIKNRLFQQACELMVQAQSVDRTKMYMRIWEKMDNGEYRSINLNFSSI